MTGTLRVITDSSDDDHLTMEDLISYSFQVAKGMEFLSSRKVGTQFYVCVCTAASRGSAGGGEEGRK